MTDPVVVRPRERIVARHRSPADLRWEREGKPHYLNRTAFEKHLGLARSLSTTAVSVNPFVELLAPLAMLYAVWQATKYLCPPATGILSWFARLLRRLLRNLFRLLHRPLWRNPVQQYGVLMTLWFWGCAFVAFVFLTSLTTGQAWLFMNAVLWAGLLFVVYLAFRWRARRRYRPRPLPARRRIQP